MTKILVLSDSHGNRKGIEGLRGLIAENDLVIHLGDGAGDMREIFSEYPEKTYICSGNCDFGSPYPAEGILSVEYLNIFYCHGHYYGVKEGLERLAQAAKSRGCQIALYGHTHHAAITEIDGVTLINPGNLRFCVGQGGGYCYLVVHKEKATPVLVGDSLR